MSTATVSKQPAEVQRKLVERQAPTLVEFDKPGVVVSGILRNCERVRIKESKLVIQYTIFDPVQKRFLKILGTWDINQKIHWPEDAGRFVRISYLRDNPNVGASKGNALREFKIEVDEVSTPAPVHFSDGTEITDADIPF
jgi:hypothetical protein